MELFVKVVVVVCLLVASRHCWEVMANSRQIKDPFQFFQYGFLLVFFGIILSGQL